MVGQSSNIVKFGNRLSKASALLVEWFLERSVRAEEGSKSAEAFGLTACRGPNVHRSPVLLCCRTTPQGRVYPPLIPSLLALAWPVVGGSEILPPPWSVPGTIQSSISYP